MKILIKLPFILFFCSIFSENLPLRVGMELSYPPFEMIDPEGKPIGISVDMAYALAKFLNRPAVIDNIPFIGLIPSLKTNKIDVIISSLTITEARKEAIDFSIPYITTGLCLLVSKKKSKIHDIKDVNKKNITIVVKSGTSGESYAKEFLTKTTLIILDKESSCVLEVVQGKADAFIYDQFSIFTNWQKNLETTYAILTPFQKENWGIGIKKGNKELLETVNIFIKKFKEEGGFEELGNRYLSEQKKAFKALGVPFVF